MQMPLAANVVVMVMVIVVVIVHRESKKHQRNFYANFGKFWPILIILSPLHFEITEKKQE